MAYDKGLAQRVREILEDEPGFDEKNMFGGICFLLFGNMVCGIIKDDLIVRVGADRYAEMLKMPVLDKTTGEEPDKTPESLNANVPALIVVVPTYIFDPLNVNVPVRLLVSPPVPEITPP